MPYRRAARLYEFQGEQIGISDARELQQFEKVMVQTDHVLRPTAPVVLEDEPTDLRPFYSRHRTSSPQGAAMMRLANAFGARPQGIARMAREVADVERVKALVAERQLKPTYRDVLDEIIADLGAADEATELTALIDQAQGKGRTHQTLWVAAELSEHRRTVPHYVAAPLRGIVCIDHPIAQEPRLEPVIMTPDGTLGVFPQHRVQRQYPSLYTST